MVLKGMQKSIDGVLNNKKTNLTKHDDFEVHILKQKTIIRENNCKKDELIAVCDHAT